MFTDKLAGARAPMSSRRTDGPRGDGPGYRPLRCQGEVAFASPLAADVARLLDVDPEVDHWRCWIAVDGLPFPTDFVTYGDRGVEHVFVRPEGTTDADCDDLPSGSRVVTPSDIDPVRLENAKLILPLARWRVSLDDRVRLLAALDEEGSVTLADCLSIIRHTSRPVAAVAALALARVVDLDLDMPLGARTRVIRRAD
ncbi:hypothetical protein [Aureimonas sp. SK2]|uniref:hypothetical protein n=1 Tax=Aureimonas sp. SK2 TaxID=3015992 RepID=UPI002444E197|nr:hypothetical protein [Aureimonas sp. SK2]